MDVSSAVIRALNESIRPYLSEGRAGYHFWLSTSTFFVGLGVVLEAPETFREARKEFSEYWMHRWGRRRIALNAFGLPVVTPERRRLPWIAAISVIGWLIVAVGVVGEFWFDDKVSAFDATLQMIDNDLLAQANVEAGNANRAAGDAIERAGNANRDAGIARLDASNANTLAKKYQSEIAASDARAKSAEAQVASAKAASDDAVARVALAEARTAEAQRDAAEAQSMARSADLARAELEARIAPRTLNISQREYLGRKLRPFARQFMARPIKLDWSLADVEETIVAVEIEDSLKRADIDVERPTVLTLGGPLNIGIAIKGPSKDATFINLIYAILRADFPNESMSFEALPKHNGLPVTITVGVKTPGGLETLPVPEIPVPTPRR